MRKKFQERRVFLNYKLFTAFGLLSDFVGAIFLAFGLIITKKKAIELGVAWLLDETNTKNNLKTPTVKDRLDQSKNAIIGLIFLLFGFSLQLIGCLGDDLMPFFNWIVLNLSKIIASLGLLCDLTGGILLAYNIIIVSINSAIKASDKPATIADVKPPDKDTPSVKETMKQHKKAIWGTVLLSCGFVLQIIGAWIK